MNENEIDELGLTKEERELLKNNENAMICYSHCKKFMPNFKFYLITYHMSKLNDISKFSEYVSLCEEEFLDLAGKYLKAGEMIQIFEDVYEDVFIDFIRFIEDRDKRKFTQKEIEEIDKKFYSALKNFEGFNKLEEDTFIFILTFCDAFRARIWDKLIKRASIEEIEDVILNVIDVINENKINEYRISKIWKIFEEVEPREKFILLLKNSEKIENKNEEKILNYIHECEVAIYKILKKKEGIRKIKKMYENAIEKVSEARKEIFLSKYHKKLFNEYCLRKKINPSELKVNKSLLRYINNEYSKYIEKGEDFEKFLFECIKECNIVEWEALKKHISIEEINGIFENIAKNFNKKVIA